MSAYRCCPGKRLLNGCSSSSYVFHIGLCAPDPRDVAGVITCWWLCLSVSLFVAGILQCMCNNGAIPLYYELAIESTYPVAEVCTSMMMTVTYNVLPLIFLAINYFTSGTLICDNVGTPVCHDLGVLCSSLCLSVSLPSSRHHLSCEDCLEDNMDQQNCSVLCYVWHLCTISRIAQEVVNEFHWDFQKGVCLSSSDNWRFLALTFWLWIIKFERWTKYCLFPRSLFYGCVNVNNIIRQRCFSLGDEFRFGVAQFMRESITAWLCWQIWIFLCIICVCVCVYLGTNLVALLSRYVNCSFLCHSLCTLRTVWLYKQTAVGWWLWARWRKLDELVSICRSHNFISAAAEIPRGV